MTSNDNKQFVTVEIFNSAMNKIDKHFDIIDGKFEVVRAEILAVKELALVNSAKIDAYKDTTNTWFTVLAVIIAFVGFIVALAPTFREMFKEARLERKNKQLTREDVQNMINASVSQAVNDAVAKALGTSGK